MSGRLTKPAVFFEQVKIVDVVGDLPDSGERFYLYIVRFPAVRMYVWDYNNSIFIEYSADISFYDTFDDFPIIGEENRLYLSTSSLGIYHWNGGEYLSLGGTGEAPVDGKVYGRKDANWIEIEENKDKHYLYVHDQGMPSKKWICTHNLGKFPSVTVIDSSKTIVEGNVEYINLNQVEIEFNSKFSGEAYFN